MSQTQIELSSPTDFAMVDVSDALLNVVDELANMSSGAGCMRLLVGDIRKPQVHPYLKFAWQITSSLNKATEAVIQRYNLLLDHASPMVVIFALVVVIGGLQNESL
ncbi:hypothetical protein HWV62_22235 [Athelia sp. TMB]|nr:hypothetical protein HWV62_22235 [Athelia sp. TMB]